MKSIDLALTATEWRRIAALRSAIQTETTPGRTDHPCDALIKDHVFARDQAKVIYEQMLGDWRRRDGFSPWLAQFHRQQRQTAGRWTLGHLLPGNHPGGVLSALVPGWLLGCRQIVRPSERLAHFTTRIVAHVGRALKQQMRSKAAAVTLRRWNHRANNQAPSLRAFLQACDVVTVQGSDVTVESIQTAWQGLPARQRPVLIAFSNRLSLVAIDCEGVRPEHPAPAARAAAVGAVNKTAAATVAAQLVAAGQTGCLCPHGIVLVGGVRARGRWLNSLAEAMAAMPGCPSVLTREEALAIGYQHHVYRALEQAGEPGFRVREWARPGGRREAVGVGGAGDGHGADGLRGRFWQVPLTEKPTALTGGSYSVWQANTVGEAARAIKSWDTPLQAIGCVPGPRAFARAFAGMDCWVTGLEQLHSPPPDWPQDGCDLLTRLMRLAEAGA